MSRPPVALLLLTLLSLTSSAQSVDCKLAQSPREHALCTGKLLPTLDAEIAASYKSLRDQLSPQSSALVESDQHEWQQWVVLVCPERTRPSATYDLSHCLQTQYTARARDLKQTERLGSATLFTRAHFLYRPSEQLSQQPAPGYPGFGYGSLRWPQLDRKSGPLSPSEVAFNKLVQTKSAQLGAGILNGGASLTFDTAVNALEDIEAGYTIEGANDRLIEVSLITSSYVWVPSASTLTIHSNLLWWLDRNRQLTADDVFQSASAWQAFLVSVATGRLQENTRLKPLLRDDAHLEQALQLAVPETSNWSLSHNGLTLTFMQGIVADNTAGMPRVFISWDDLKPFLVPDLDPTTLPARLPNPRP